MRELGQQLGAGLFSSQNVQLPEEQQHGQRRQQTLETNGVPCRGKREDGEVSPTGRGRAYQALYLGEAGPDVRP